MKAWKWVALASIAAGGACADAAEPLADANPESLVANAEHLHQKCEGPHGLSCPPGKFCATAKANRCPGAETKGTCRHIPEACSDIYQPTCGCDGQTYSNECRAAAVSVAVAYEGPCAPFCGGFAGVPCPGAGSCVDNPTDGCDPSEGDVDCASLCRCDVAGLCNEGTHWDSSPVVCGCVED
jgi:hypothetical protein